LRGNLIDFWLKWNELRRASASRSAAEMPRLEDKPEQMTRELVERDAWTERARWPRPTRLDLEVGHRRRPAGGRIHHHLPRTHAAKPRYARMGGDIGQPVVRKATKRF
jgi:hypothetical protein